MYSGVPHCVIVADASLKRLIPKSPILTTAGSSKTKQFAGFMSRCMNGGSDECRKARPRAIDSAMRSSRRLQRDAADAPRLLAVQDAVERAVRRELEHDAQPRHLEARGEQHHDVRVAQRRGEVELGEVRAELLSPSVDASCTLTATVVPRHCALCTAPNAPRASSAPISSSS